MKKILLSTAAVFAFAGAAAAEVTWGGDAEISHNSEDGFSYAAGLSVKASQELNNGWTAALSLDVDLDAENDSYDLGDIQASDLVFSISSDMGGLYLGDTDTAAQKFWSGVTDMAQDGFTEGDEYEDGTVRGEVIYGGVTAAVSYGIDTGANEIYDMQFAAQAALGGVDLSVAYQSDADGDDRIFGLSAGFTVGGADLLVAYADNEGDTSTGIKVTYPVGATSVVAHYVAESVGQDSYGVAVTYTEDMLTAKGYYKSIQGSDEFGVAASYDLGNGLVLTGGLIDGDSTSDDDFGQYLVAEYDLGGGATFTASYANATNNGGQTSDMDTTLGGYELDDGLTLTLGLKF